MERHQVERDAPGLDCAGTIGHYGHRMVPPLGEKGISRKLDVWGHDVGHDWPWWRKQLAHHRPRFC